MPKLIYSKRSIDLSPEEVEACMRCNRGSMGSMRGLFKMYRERTCSRATMCWIDGELVGWCHVYKGSDDRHILHTYVKPTHRRQGIGTELVTQARRRLRKPLYACPWDDRSRSFYEPMLAADRLRNAYDRS